jgi:hypothetical protein
MFLENVMLLEVEIIFLVVHLGINYVGFLCVSTSLIKIVVFPHIWVPMDETKDLLLWWLQHERHLLTDKLMLTWVQELNSPSFDD